jgi:hypothetical protein
VIFNNTIINCNIGVGLVNYGDNFAWRLHDLWVWNNTCVNVATPFSTSPGSFSITEGVDYWIRAPTQALDGFSYASYPYPHPLTIG